jgi:hypothetical protein
MAAVYAIWKRLSQVRLDGVNYDIGVKEGNDGRFSVAWVCLKCCEQGPPAPAALNLDQAARFAEIGLHAHHALIHQTARETVAEPCLPSPSCDSMDVNRKAIEHRQAVFAHVEAVFEQLCAAQAELRTNVANIGTNGGPPNLCANAYCDWNRVAREFLSALDVFSSEVDRRANELDTSNSRASAGA